MNPQEASALLAFARQHDHLVLSTDAAAQTWAAALGARPKADGQWDDGIPFAAGQLVVQDYYGMHPDPHNRKPIDASVIRKLYYSKARERESKHRAIAPPKHAGKNRAPRWFIVEEQRRGRMLDRDPLDYEDRPRRNDPTRERHP